MQTTTRFDAVHFSREQNQIGGTCYWQAVPKQGAYFINDEAIADESFLVVAASAYGRWGLLPAKAETAATVQRLADAVREAQLAAGVPADRGNGFATRETILSIADNMGIK